MSGTVAHCGRLIPMVLNGASMEERAEEACKQFGYERCDIHDSWLACLNDEGYRTVYIRGDIIYKIEDNKLDAGNLAKAFINKDGSVDYILEYYSGGASFNEVLDDAMDGTE